MRTCMSLCFVFCVVLAGCSGNPPGTGGKGTEGEPGASTQSASQMKAGHPGRNTIDTGEIIRILEKEQIRGIGTAHNQSISIELVDGRKFLGTYVPEEAGKYSADKNLSDILNLVMHIKKNRPPEEVKNWNIWCE
ncbi:MAG: hypothetical protein GY851_33155 [bacterium]|nr:hypothetical protein [bacterium]